MTKYPKCGIYKITSPSGNVYIGQSREIRKRVSKYKTTDCWGMPGIYNSFKKYGWENHSFEVICILPNDISQEDLNNQEHAYWYIYKEAGFTMLNTAIPGNSQRPSAESIEKTAAWHRGKKRSAETCKKLSDAKKGTKQTAQQVEKRVSQLRGRVYGLGRKMPLELKNKLIEKFSIPIIQLTLEGILIKEWPSAAIAGKELNIDSSMIRKACKMEKYKSAGGFRWKNKE